MYIGKVIGNVVATKKEDSLTGYKLMIVDLVQSSGEEAGKTIVAVDLVGAGRGEHVLVTCGSAARVNLQEAKTSIDAAIVGIIDSFEGI
ncbi:ethanolamine utilization protein EutN [Niallia circulans]|jgi:ethanolamine utilization protein EutN|uniref:EutN/CcmL family microcompartment protein n=1 Tax=Niallia circulans TaxID=1397 RepID=UPI000BA5E4BB|nr:EutN/CcmL family microcompartment protein [Niallia circulans]PAD88060.1 ethanolamine utilization protein EutN [Niallia circulans]